MVKSLWDRPHSGELLLGDISVHLRYSRKIRDQVFGAVAGDLANIKLIKFCSNSVHSRLLIFLAAFVFDIFQVIGICHEEICG